MSCASLYGQYLNEFTCRIFFLRGALRACHTVIKQTWSLFI